MYDYLSSSHSEVKDTKTFLPSIFILLWDVEKNYNKLRKKIDFFFLKYIFEIPPMCNNFKPSMCPLIPWKLNCHSIISLFQSALSRMQQHASEFQGFREHLLETGVSERAGMERSGKVKSGIWGGGLKMFT